MTGTAPPGRSLGGYLLLPRPEDLVKWVITPVAVLLTVLGGEPDRARVPLAVVVAGWLGSEYLVHSARYQWNDLLGADQDAVHPYALARRRLPRGRTDAQRVRNRRLSAAVLTVRLLAAAAGLVALQAWGGVPGLAGELALLGVALLALACGYEGLRSGTRRCPADRTRPREIAVWVLVGGGYAVRGLTGFVLAGQSPRDPAAWAGTVFAGALGVMFVLVTWTLEGAAFCVLTPDGRVLYRPGLADKSHLAALLHTAGLAPVAPLPGGTPGVELSRVAVLDSTRLRPYPWIVALLVAASAGGAVMVALPATGPGPVRAAVVVLAPALLAAAHVAVPPRRRRWHLAAGAAALAVVHLATAAPAARTDPGPLLVAVLPWLLVCGLFDGFRRCSYADLKAAAGGRSDPLPRDRPASREGRDSDSVA